MGAQESIDEPARRDVPVEGDEALAREPSGRNARAPREAVVGRAGDDELVGTQRHDLELRAAGRTRDDAQVGAAVEALAIHLVRAPVDEAQADLRLGAQERLHRAGQGVQPHAVDEGDGHRTGDDVGALAQALAERREAHDDGARLGVDQLARLGWLEAAARAAVEQAHAEVTLEPAEDRRFATPHRRS